MAITRADVAKVALLARLEFTDEELDALTPQLADIVGYVDQLSEIDTDGVEPMAHALDTHSVLKPDEVRASLPRDEALANAPNHTSVGYLVPAVLGE